MNAVYMPLNSHDDVRVLKSHLNDMRDPVKLNQMVSGQKKPPADGAGKHILELADALAKLILSIGRAIKKFVLTFIARVTGLPMGQQQQQAQQEQIANKQDKEHQDKEQLKENDVSKIGEGAIAANDEQFDVEKKVNELTQQATNSFVDALEKHMESPEFAQLLADFQSGTKSPQEVMDALANSSLETLRQNHDNLKTVLESELDETLKSDIPETALRRAAIQEIISGLPTIEPTYSTVSNPQILEKVNHVLRESSVGVEAFVAAKATLAGMTEAQNQGEFNLEQNDQPVEIPEFLKKPKFPTVQDDASVNMQEFEVAKKYDDEDGRSRPKG